MHCCLYYRHSGISQELSKDLSANSVVVGRHSTTLEVALSFPPKSSFTELCALIYS